MKSFLLHIVLFIYTASVIKPVLPVMVDALAHTFQELEHTRSVHAHKGEQHVHLEMLSLATEQQENVPAAKIEVSVTPHLPSKIELSFLSPLRQPATWAPMISILPVTYLSMPLPPPKC